uniref:Uncharacterized protein n=1 Tax=Sphaerodactylus townsendi TaxID=933632 RepID=A0ACB8EFY8_9SAUR
MWLQPKLLNNHPASQAKTGAQISGSPSPLSRTFSASTHSELPSQDPGSGHGCDGRALKSSGQKASRGHVDFSEHKESPPAAQWVPIPGQVSRKGYFLENIQLYVAVLVVDMRCTSGSCLAQQA